MLYNQYDTPIVYQAMLRNIRQNNNSTTTYLS